MSRLRWACWRCGEPIGGAQLPPGYCCSDCRLHPPAFERLVAVWHYLPPLDAVMHHLKFTGLAHLGAHLAAAIHSELAEALESNDIIVPVPLHWQRRIARSYNQAEEIARPLSRLLGLPLARALRRRRKTMAQSTLPRRERSTNLQGAFAARPRVRVAETRIVLVDDVTTTGSTLDECASVLLRAGASRVVAVAAARTPPPGWSDGVLAGILKDRSGVVAS